MIPKWHEFMAPVLTVMADGLTRDRSQITDLAAVEAGVVLISAGPGERTNSSRAQGGSAAAIGPDDTTELHEQDTYIAGRGLCRPSAVQILVRGAAARIQDLVDIGVPFSKLPRLQHELEQAGYIRPDLEWPSYRALWRHGHSAAVVAEHA